MLPSTITLSTLMLTHRQSNGLFENLQVACCWNWFTALFPVAISIRARLISAKEV